MIFAKQSTRTRISFEVGLHQLGAQPLALSTSGGTGMQMGRGETVEDTAKVLSRFVHAIVIRTFGQDQVDGLAEHGTIPVVNALTDLYHPCQALADLLTLREHLGTTKGKKLVYVGAGNNVAHSLMLAGPRSGMDVVVSCPDSLRPNAGVLARGGTLEERLYALAKNRIEFAGRNLDLVKAIFQELLLDPEFRERLRERFVQRLLPAARLAIAQGIAARRVRAVEAEQVLRMLISLVGGYVVARHILLPDRAWDDEAELRLMIDVLLRGLAPAP